MNAPGPLYKSHDSDAKLQLRISVMEAWRYACPSVQIT